MFWLNKQCVIDGGLVVSRLQVGVLLVGQRHVGGGLHLLLVGGHGLLVNLNLRGSKGGSGDELLQRRLVL